MEDNGRIVNIKKGGHVCPLTNHMGVTDDLPYFNKDSDDSKDFFECDLPEEFLCVRNKLGSIFLISKNYVEYPKLIETSTT